MTTPSFTADDIAGALSFGGTPTRPRGGYTVTGMIARPVGRPAPTPGPTPVRGIVIGRPVPAKRASVADTATK